MLLRCILLLVNGHLKSRQDSCSGDMPLGKSMGQFQRGKYSETALEEKDKSRKRITEIQYDIMSKLSTIRK